MVGYNDTIQTPHDFGNPAEQLWDFGPLSLQLWNSIRVVDFLQSLPGVDASRIGATGASGGGTQTFLLAAVDDRIQFSAPVNMISAIMQGGGLCENAPNLRLDTFNVEIGAMMAPRPMIMIAATGDWTKNNATEEFPAVRAIYELYDKRGQRGNDASTRRTITTRRPRGRLPVLRQARARRDRRRQIQGDATSALEKLQDMLALHNRKLPDNALDYDGSSRSGCAPRRSLVGEITDRSQMREMLEFALGAEWPERVVSEATGEKIVFARPGRGDRVTGFWLPGEGRKLLFIHPDGAEAARKSPNSPRWCAPAGPSIRSMRSRPAPPWRRATATPRCSSPSTAATMPTACRTSSPCCLAGRARCRTGRRRQGGRLVPVRRRGLAGSA